MPQIAKNAPCPCGSGKKYKRCCENKSLLPFKSKGEQVKLEFDALEFYRKFNFSELLIWLQSVLCHPANQRYTHRCDFFF
jgi:hypothetical protein